MKKVILLIALMLTTFTVTSFSQYSRWALSGEYGIHTISDKTALADDYFNHFGAGLRYNFNEGFSLGVTGGYDDIDVIGLTGTESKLHYTRFNAEAYLNAFRLLNLKDDNWTMLLHGGPGVSFINTNNNYDQTVMNLRGGATLMYKFSDRWALTADYSMVGNMNQDMTLDGDTYATPAAGVSSSISSVSVGVSYYFDKLRFKKKEEPKDDEDDGFIHGDWYYAPVAAPIVNEVTNVTKITNVYPKDTLICEHKALPFRVQEFVFFDHDLYDIRDTELNAIYKVYIILNEDDEHKLVIKGFASPTSSSDEYNLSLSAKRSKEVERKFIDMGVDPARIIYKYYGKDKTLDVLNVHDAARRVELRVVNDEDLEEYE